MDASHLLVLLTNVRSIIFGSPLLDMRHRFAKCAFDIENIDMLHPFGLFPLRVIQAFLANGPSMKEPKFTCAENLLFANYEIS